MHRKYYIFLTNPLLQQNFYLLRSLRTLTPLPLTPWLLWFRIRRPPQSDMRLDQVMHLIHQTHPRLFTHLRLLVHPLGRINSLRLNLNIRHILHNHLILCLLIPHYLAIASATLENRDFHRLVRSILYPLHSLMLLLVFTWEFRYMVV